MSDRLDAVAFRKGKDGKTYYTNIGVAWPNKSGEGYTVVLHAMPVPEEGAYRIGLFVPKNVNKRSDGPDDEVPF